MRQQVKKGTISLFAPDNRRCRLLLPWLLPLLASACVDISDYQEGDAGDGGLADLFESCTSSQTRCVGQSYQVCSSGRYVEQTRCDSSKVCTTTLGCVECDPAEGMTCLTNNVHLCGKDGRTGAEVKKCLGLKCELGACRSPACAVGARLIYVVDSDYQLLSFDPTRETSHFVLIKKLSCPAGSPWPYRPAPATPFSMSVDRSARAWVLYTSGEIFWVETKTGDCTLAPFTRGQAGFELFGMGFVADAPKSSSEKLYVARARTDTSTQQELGVIDPATMKLTSIATMTVQAENSPELTGTGNAELLAYFPGISSSFVALLDKKTGKVTKSWPVTPLGSQVTAWAFAHWGGRYYIFVTTSDGTTDKSFVLSLDPKTGQCTTFLSSIAYRIVGAGVSTCAPVVR